MPSIDIYFGAPITNASERCVLERCWEHLTEHRTDAVILVNVQIRSRQIDLILARSDRVLVIEAKGASNPLKGRVNGDWTVQLPSRNSKPTRNYYLQALEGSHSVRDAIRTFVGEHVPYPRAALVLVPAIPDGSEIPVSTPE